MLYDEDGVMIDTQTEQDYANDMQYEMIDSATLAQMQEDEFDFYDDYENDEYGYDFADDISDRSYDDYEQENDMQLDTQQSKEQDNEFTEQIEQDLQKQAIKVLTEKLTETNINLSTEAMADLTAQIITSATNETLQNIINNGEKEAEYANNPTNNINIESESSKDKEQSDGKLQDSKAIETISLIKEEIERDESIQEKENTAINAINDFQNNFKDIDNLIYDEKEKEKATNTLFLVKSEIKKRDETLGDKELVSITAMKDFKQRYSAINTYLDKEKELNQAFEKMQETDLEGSKVAKFANAIGKGAVAVAKGTGKFAVAVAKETKDLIIGKGQDHELDLAKESDDLNKALDNIVKTHSLADFVRALYTLDKALYQMGEAQEKPADKPLMKEMLNDLEKGKPLTKETAEKALEEMQNSKEKLDNFILQREKELNNKQALEKTIEKYNAEKSMDKKTEYATNINDRLKYIDEYLPSFKENEKNTLEKAKDTLKKHEHEKSMVKQKDLGFMGKGRER